MQVSWFQGWLNSWDIRLPKETKATCDNCLMAREHKFKAHLKCCTFQPFLSCFLVGGILSSGESRAVERLQGVLRSETGALPIGLLPSADFQQRFFASEKSEFGNREDLLCGFFSKSTQNCSIWSFRPSPCISYFCESSHGENGQQYWRKLEDFLNFLEFALIFEGLQEMGWTYPEITACLRYYPQSGEKKVVRLTESEQKRLWCEFGEHKSVFYKKSFEWVTSLSARDVRNLLSTEGEEKIRELQKWSQL